MNHEMRLFPEQFKKVVSGEKRREYRLCDEKRQAIRPGDTITFFSTDCRGSVTVLVESLHIYQDFKTCYRDFWTADFANSGKTLDQLLRDTYENWWSQEQEAAYGCVVIQFKSSQ